MSLVVEDGTGLSTAESYASVSAADTRLAALGQTLWATDMTTTEKEQALRRATQFMLQAYRSNWKGHRINSTQALDWPRAYVVIDGWYQDSDEVPATVANACIDLALKAAAGDLNEDLERAVTSEQIGPIKTTYSEHSPQRKRFPSIDMALAPYLMGSGSNARLMRA